VYCATPDLVEMLVTLATRVVDTKAGTDTAGAVEKIGSTVNTKVLSLAKVTLVKGS
jgi:hypothetical protein